MSDPIAWSGFGGWRRGSKMLRVVQALAVRERHDGGREHDECGNEKRGNGATVRQKNTHEEGGATKGGKQTEPKRACIVL